MQLFSDKVQNAVIDDENIDAESAEYRAEGDAADPVDPKSARKEAVWGMKRELIMDAAIKVMARVGFMSVRLEEVAEEAGFSKAAIYHYFPDKEALIMNIVIREHRAVYEHLAEVSDRELSFVDSIRELTATLHKTLFGTVSGGGALGPPSMLSPSMLSTIVVSMTKHEELFNETIMLRKKMNDILIKIIARAKADGSFTIPIDDRSVCLYINAFYQAIMMENMHSCHVSGAPYDCGAINEAADKLLLLFSPWIREKG
jgi:AcrR family transcriptional regulator